MQEAIYYDKYDRIHRLRPLGDQVVVERTELPDRSQGGLYLLGREWPAYGRVLAVGPGRRGKRGGRIPLDDIQPGDEVAFDKSAAETRVVPDTSDILILNYKSLFMRARNPL